MACRRHEIMSPPLSLMALRGSAVDASHRYISRMQQAVRVLFGHASPSDAFQSTTLQLDSIDAGDDRGAQCRDRGRVHIGSAAGRRTGRVGVDE